MDNIVKMNRTKLKLSDLNPHLMCVLCGGYYIDATTIVECLHSFCRSCIVKHLESSKYCPICEVQVHKTKPLVNIRPDKTLQDIVYKLVPGLFENEMRNRRKFYRERPHYMKPNDSESVGEVSEDSRVYIHDENITLSLDYHRTSKQGNLENSFQEINKQVKSEKRYFKCPAGVTIYHLQKLLKAKYDLNDNNYKVEIYFKDQTLHEEFTLLDISYIYLWKSKGTLDLTFKIFENVVKRQKLEELKEEPLWEAKKDLDDRLQPVQQEQQQQQQPCDVTIKAELPSPEPVKRVEEPKAADPPKTESKEPDAATPASEPVKQNGLSGDECKEVQLQISESGVMSVSQIENGEVVRTVEESALKMVDGYINKSNTGIVPGGDVPKASDEADKQEKLNKLVPKQTKQSPKPVKLYKTIHYAPKSWNPVIPREKLRPTLMKNSDEPKKPLKFFKMRNMPRFLGNPASGVKPMYAESSENGQELRPEERNDNNTKTLKNILKIDPKTLRPIEKEEIPIISTPSTPNLLTNPFIPNNNHFLLSDPLLMHPNLGKDKNASSNSQSSSSSSSSNSSSNGNSSNASSGSSNNINSNSPGKSPGSSRSPIQNGTFPPICFQSPNYCSNFFPYQTNFPKPNFYSGSDKIDPLIRASRLSPFPNLPGFPGFHASLPPSISLLLKHQSSYLNYKKSSSQLAEKRGLKDESTKETNKNCDDNSLKLSVNDKKDKEKDAKKESVSGNSEIGKKSLQTEGGLEKKQQQAVEIQKKMEVVQKKMEEIKKKIEEVKVKGDEVEIAKKEQEVKDEKEVNKVEVVEEKKEDKKDGNDDGKAVEDEARCREEKEAEKKEEANTEKVESGRQEESSACNDEAKPDNIDNNNDDNNKSINDKER